MFATTAVIENILQALLQIGQNIIMNENFQIFSRSSFDIISGNEHYWENLIVCKCRSLKQPVDILDYVL